LPVARQKAGSKIVKRLRVLALVLALVVGACESPEDRAEQTFQECATSFGYEEASAGFTYSRNGAYALVVSRLPDPAATECTERMNEALRTD
jgi:hypothetical protein